jgi:hypothetical protein
MDHEWGVQSTLAAIGVARSVSTVAPGRSAKGFADLSPPRCSCYVLDMAGEIDTLGKAAYRQMALRVSCRLCQRGTYFWANDLAGMYGNHRSPHSLTFRCRECGKTDCEVEFTEIDFDRRPKGIVWVPKKMG